MVHILTIYDTEYNGKTGKKIFENYCLGSCILNFKENTRVCFKKFNFNNNTKCFYNDKNLIDLKLIKIIIFNYNEDNSLCNLYIKKTKKLINIIINLFPKIIIFNNPLNHELISNKYITYKKIRDKNFKYTKIPKFGLLDEKIKRRNYPVIISLKKQSGGKGKFLINHRKELNEHLNNPDKKFWSKFYESSFLKTKLFICIRTFIFCDKLVDFIVRPSNNWNVHTGNQIINKNLILIINKYFEKYFSENKTYIQNIINELYSLTGDGLYAHDFIFVNNQLILCELGYKTIDPKLIMFFETNNISSNKLCIDKHKVKNTYKNLLLNY